MKKIVLFLMLTTALFCSKIDLVVENIQSKDGVLKVALYSNADEYEKQSYFRGINLKVDGEKRAYAIEDVPNGVYAIAIYHDVNQNEKLDTNFFGVPKEPYGFSNNPTSFKRPSFDEVKFTLEDSVHVLIILK